MPDTLTRVFLFAVLLSIPLLAAAAEPLSDPTRPPVIIDIGDAFDSGEFDSLTLSAVLISPTRRLAVINGQQVGPGDEVAGARVLKINPWGVELDDAGDALELRLSRRTLTSAASPPEEP